MAGDRGARLRRFVAVALPIGALLALLLLFFLVGAWLWLRTPAGNRAIALWVVARIEGAMVEGDLQVGGLETDLWSRVILTDVALRDGAGDVVVGADRLEATLDLWPLNRDRLRVPALRAEGLVVDLVSKDGVLNINRIFGNVEPSGDPWTGLPIDFVIGDLALDRGSFRYRSGESDWHLRDIAGTGTFQAIGPMLHIAPVDLSARMLAPEDTPARFTGGLMYDGDRLVLLGGHLALVDGRVSAVGAIPLVEGGEFSLGLGADPIALPEIDALIGNPGMEGAWRGPVGVTGPLAALRIRGDLLGVTAGAGSVSADMVFDLAGDVISWTGEVDTRAFDVEHLVPKVGGELVITGRFVGTGRGTAWPEDLVIDGQLATQEVRVFDYTLFSTAGPVHLERGVLTLAGSAVRSPFGGQDVRGSVDLVGGALDLRIAGSLQPEALDRFGVEDLRGRYAVDLRLTGDIFEPGIPLRAVGTVTGHGFRYGSQISFARLSAGFDAALRAGAARVAVTSLHGIDADLYGVGIDELFATRTDVDRDAAGGVVVQGALRAEGVAIPGGVDIEEASGTFETAVTAAGAITAAADLRVGRFSWERVGGTHGEVSVALADDIVSYDLDLFERAREVLATRGTLAIETSRVEMEELRLSPREGAVFVGEGTQVFTVLPGGGIGDADVTLLSDKGDIRFLGTFHPDGEVDATVDVHRLDLAEVDWIARLESGLSGRLDVMGTLGGSAHDLALDVRVSAAELKADALAEPIDAHGTLSGAGDVLTVDLEVEVEAAALMSISGRVPVNLDVAALGLDRGGAIDLGVAVRPGRFARFSPFTGELELPEGAISGELRVEGPVRDPVFHATGVAALQVEGWTRTGRMEFDVRREGGDVITWGRLYEGLVHRGSLAGTATTRVEELLAYVLGEGEAPDLGDWSLFVDDLDLRLLLSGVPLQSVVRAAGLELAASGDVDGGVTIRGSPVEPDVFIGLSFGDLQVGEARIGGGFLGFVPDEAGYALSSSFSFAPVTLEGGAEQRGSLEIVGAIPLKINLRESWREWGLDQPMEISVNGDGIPLAALSAFEPGIRGAEGMVAVQGVIRGTALAPRPSLVASLQGGRADYDPLGLDLRDIRFAIEVTERHVRFTQPLVFRPYPQTSRVERDLEIFRLEPTRQQPLVQVRGAMTLDDLRPGRVQANLDLQHAWISGRRDQQIRVHGTAGEGARAVEVSGSWPELSLVGSVLVEYASITRDAATFLQTGPLEIDEIVDVHRPGAEEGEGELLVVAERVVEEPPPWSEFSVDIGVDLGSNVEVAASMVFSTSLGDVGAALFRLDVNARAGGEITVTVEGGALDLQGAVEVLDGTARIFGGQLDLQRGGTVDFITGDYLNPLLDLTAVRDVQGAEVILEIAGTPEEPEVSLYSPQYADQQAVLAMLFTGQRPEDLTGPEGMGVVSQILTSLLVAQVLGPGGLGTGLATITFDADGTIHAKRALTSGVYLEVVLRPDVRTLDRNRTELQLEWSVTREILIEGAVGDRRGRLDAVWEHRF